MAQLLHVDSWGWWTSKYNGHPRLLMRFIPVALLILCVDRVICINVRPSGVTAGDVDGGGKSGPGAADKAVNKSNKRKSVSSILGSILSAFSKKGDKDPAQKDAKEKEPEATDPVNVAQEDAEVDTSNEKTADAMNEGESVAHASHDADESGAIPKAAEDEKIGISNVPAPDSAETATNEAADSPIVTVFDAKPDEPLVAPSIDDEGAERTKESDDSDLKSSWSNKEDKLVRRKLKLKKDPRGADAKRAEWKAKEGLAALMPSGFMEKYRAAKHMILAKQADYPDLLKAWKALRAVEKPLLTSGSGFTLPPDQVKMWMTRHLEKLQAIAKINSPEDRAIALKAWAGVAEGLQTNSKAERKEWFMKNGGEPQTDESKIANPTDDGQSGGMEEAASSAADDASMAGDSEAPRSDSPPAGSAEERTDRAGHDEESTQESSTNGMHPKVKDKQAKLARIRATAGEVGVLAQEKQWARKDQLATLMPPGFLVKYKATKAKILGTQSDSSSIVPAWKDLRRAERRLLGDGTEANRPLLDWQITEWMKHHLEHLQKVAAVSEENRSEELRKWAEVARHLYRMNPTKRTNWFQRKKWESRKEKLAAPRAGVSEQDRRKEWARKDTHSKEMADSNRSQYSAAKAAIVNGFSPEQTRQWRQWRATEMKLMDVLPTEQRKKWISAHIERMKALARNASIDERLDVIKEWTEDVDQFLPVHTEYTAWVRKHGLISEPSSTEAAAIKQPSMRTKK